VNRVSAATIAWPRLIVTVEEAADILSLSRSKIYSLIRSGKIRALKIGRSRRIPVAELQRFVELELAAA
jgi:excisionase family DNA binding protein